MLEIESFLTPFLEILTKGCAVYKLKLNGTPCPVLTHGRVEILLPYFTFHVAVTYGENGAKELIAQRPVKGSGAAAIKLNGQDLPGSRMTLSLVKHLSGVDLKVTMDYSEKGLPQEIELYAELVSLPFLG